MNQDNIQPKRRSGSLARVIRVLLAVAVLTGVGLSLGACSFCWPGPDGELECQSPPSG